MRINKLKLKNFRNHKNISLEFKDDLILIFGKNGTGKTNILEAIYTLATGKSQRSKYDKDLIAYEALFCTIEGNILKEGEEIDLNLQVIKNENFENVSSKKAKVNKVAKSLQYFTGILNCVFFSPEDIRIITNSPTTRRKFMDLILIQTDKNYKKALSLYTKAVRQRNKLLERIFEENRGQDEISFWTNEALLYGKLIQKKRTELFEELENYSQKHINKLSNKDVSFKTNYKCNVISEARLEKYKQKEILARTTLVGPHRDDFEVYYDEHNVSDFGSRGEQRSTILALKLAEIQFIENASGEKPVLLLDDIFSELDEDHKRAVLETIDGQQTIITSAEEIDFLENRKTQIIRL